METIISELSKPIWWVTVVIAGILINLISAYSKPVIDKLFSAISSNIRKRNQEIEKEKLRYIERLTNDQFFFIREQFSELRLRIQSIYALVVSVFIVAVLNLFFISKIINIIFMAMASTSFFFSYYAFLLAAKKARIMSNHKKI